MKKTKTILVTGATGNVGFALINYLLNNELMCRVVAGVRDVERSEKKFKQNDNLYFRTFDFDNPDTFADAFTDIDCVFLLRPPHISDVALFFTPLFEQMKAKNITEIVFLSVQGAEKSSIIPHNKIEKLILAYGFRYIFVRPSYFMQNLTTTLLSDIKNKREIILPAGNAKFNWIDVEDIALATANLILRFSEFENKAFEITGLENENFGKVTEIINSSLDSPIVYRSVNPFRFYSIKKNAGMAKGMIIVMIMLHFLPRLQTEPRISSFFEQLIGRKPTKLIDFVKRDLHLFH